jgi:hypothetical protein
MRVIMDNITQSLYLAVEQASPIWQRAISQLSWWHALIASGYGLAAWFCFLNAQVTKEELVPCSIWCIAAALMCLLGANVVLQADEFLTQVCRALARLQGWYGQRRELQYRVIGLFALAALGVGFWLFQWFGNHSQRHTGVVSLGLLALLLLLAVRTVSAHGTDAVIYARFVGISMGRFFELTGIALVMSGALRSLFQPWANLKLTP